MDALTAVRSGALLVEWPRLGTLVVTGPDRQSWLGAVVTCDVARLRPGEGTWGLVLTRQAKILTDINVIASQHSVHVSTAAETAAPVHAHLERMLIMEDATIQDASPTLTWLSLHGPQAAAMAKATAREFDRVAEASIDWTGRGGAALVVARDQCGAVVAALSSNASGTVCRGTDQDWQRLRIQSGLPALGVDYDDSHTPVEAALERRAVCWTKGCYVGQEVVCRQDMRGHARSVLVTLQIEGSAAAAVGSAVATEAEGEGVGHITSSAAGVAGGRAVALARVRVAAAAGKPPLTVAGRRAVIVTAAGRAG